MSSLKKSGLVLLVSSLIFNLNFSERIKNKFLEKTWIKETETGIKVYVSGNAEKRNKMYDYIGFSVYYDSNVVIDFFPKKVSKKFKEFWEIDYILYPEEKGYRRLDLSDFEGKEYTIALWDEIYIQKNENNNDSIIELLKEIDRLNGVIPILNKKEKILK